jgi:hypothetical protein
MTTKGTCALVSDVERSEKSYEEVSEPHYTHWVTTHFAVQSESGGLRFDGLCPRCEHAMTNRWFDEIYRGRHTAIAPSVEFEIPMVCTCATEHPNTPENRLGCGAYWVAEVQ